MIFKSTILLNTPLWSINAWIIIIAFLFFINKKIIIGKWNYYSAIDLSMHFILFYFIWLIFQAFILGSSFEGIFRRSWQHLIPLLFYFISYRIFDLNMFKVIERIIIITTTSISLLFLSEWIFVNIFGLPSFYWSIAIAEQQVGMDYYTSKESTTPLSNIFLKRIGGPLGTYQMTSLCISFGLVFLMNKIIYSSKKSRFHTLIYFINLIALLFTFSRTIIGVYFISIFFCYFLLKPNMKKLFIKFNYFSFVILITGLVFFVGSEIYSIIKVFLFDKVFIDIFINRTSALDIILDQAKLYFEFIKKNPILFFTGTGLGYFNNNFSMLGSDFGIITIHNLIGSFGMILFIVLYLRLKSQTKIIINLPINIQIKSIIISSFTCITIALLSFFHYSPLFHIGNYLMFYLFISIISNSVRYNHF